MMTGMFLAVSTACSGDHEKTSSKIQKEIEVEEVNGIKTVTISTIENGVETKEVFVGEEAERKLAELEGKKDVISEEVNEESVERKVEVTVDENTQEKSVVITTTINGEETVERYDGDEAEAKLKELEGEGDVKLRSSDENVIIKTKEVKRSTVKRSEDMDMRKE